MTLEEKTKLVNTKNILKTIPENIPIKDEKRIRLLYENILELLLATFEKGNDKNVYMMRTNNKIQELEKYVNSRKLEDWSEQLEMKID